jgi:hypothetical protein
MAAVYGLLDPESKNSFGTSLAVTSQHGVTSRKTGMFISTVVRTSAFAFKILLWLVSQFRGSP